jgi:hypothetical protein
MEVIGSVDGWYESYYNALGIWMTQTGNQRQAILICVDVVRIKSSYDGLEHRGMGVNCDSRLQNFATGTDVNLYRN